MKVIMISKVLFSVETDVTQQNLLTERFLPSYFGTSEIQQELKKKIKFYLPVDVEVGISGSFGVVEAFLVLRCCRPGGVGGRRGHHHEERLVAGFILEEV